MKGIVLGLLLFFQLSIFSQGKEFEGEIHYRHLYRFALKGMDTAEILKNYGSASKYFYKEGAYRWTFDSCIMAEEYFYPETGKTYNRSAEDEQFTINERNGYNKLLKYEVQENADTICGYVCNRIMVMTGNKSDKNDILVRFIFYAPELVIDPQKFKKFGSYCNYEVYKITKSAFLRIEMLSPFMPFAIRMEATKVIPRTLEKSEVSLPVNAVLK